MKAIVTVQFLDMEKGITYHVGDVLDLNKDEAKYYSTLRWVKVEEVKKPRATKKRSEV